MKSKTLIISLLIISLLGCDKPLEYRYQDKPQNVDCPGIDAQLMHEALYSFQEDIGAFYNQYTDYRAGTTSYYLEGYYQFVYFGFTGGARFQEMVSDHSLKILQKLKEVPGLFIKKEGRWALNYEHEYVDCLLKSISDEDLRTQFESIRSVDYFTPRNVAELMRINAAKIPQDPYLAMYTALDAYYQYLANLDLQPKDA